MNTKEEFLNWYNTFYKKGGKQEAFRIDDGWYDRVEKAHQSIREKLLGGPRKIFKIELENTEPIAKWTDVGHYLTELYSLIPEYFVQYELSVGSMVAPLLPKGNQFEGMKFGKHITGWILRHKKEIRGSSKEHRIHDLVSKIGKYWSEAKSRKDTLYANITTTPMAFALIGSYGPDGQSCFRQRSANQSHKYRLGQTPNSFVVIISNEEMVETDTTDRNLCRIWGFTDDKFETLHFSNRYLSRNTEFHGNIIRAIELATEQLFGCKVYHYKNIFTIDTNIYSNKDTYSISKLKDAKSLNLSTNVEKTNTLVGCVKCRSIGQVGEWIISTVNGNLCIDDAKDLSYCEYSQKWTTDHIINGFRDFKPIKFAESYKNNHFRYCEVTKQYHYHTDVKLCDGRYINVKSAQELGYQKCPYCGDMKKGNFVINKSLIHLPVCENCCKIVKDEQPSPYKIIWQIA